MKISAHSCAQTLSLAKFFISFTVSLNPNLEYTSYLRSVSHQLKGVRGDLKSSNLEISNLSIFIKIKNLRKTSNHPKSSFLWLYIYNNIKNYKSWLQINKKFWLPKSKIINRDFSDRFFGMKGLKWAKTVVRLNLEKGLRIPKMN